MSAQPRSTRRRWVLAFDASCGKCGRLSRAAAQASGELLEIMPLAHPEVRRWRDRSPAARTWAPTLIRVDGTRATVWTGTAMGVRLLRHLGPRRAIRVLGALGRTRRPEPAQRNNSAAAALLQLLSGLAVAGSLIMARTASGPGADGMSPHAWVEANKNRLPRDYDGLTAHPVPYRKAIFSALAPEVRTQLWTEHLDRYRAAHPGLADGQTEVIDRAVALVSRMGESAYRPAEELQALASAAMNAFGRDEARLLLATLGPESAPDESAAAATTDCDCANFSDWCGSGTGCTNYPRPCVESSSGCGTFWTWECNGICQPPPT